MLSLLAYDMTETSPQHAIAESLRYHWDITTTCHRCWLTISLRHHHNMLSLLAYDMTETSPQHAIAADWQYYWDIITGYNRWQLEILLGHHHKILSLPAYDITETSSQNSGELRTQKIKSHLLRTQSSKVLPLKLGIGQYIAIHATPTARDFLLGCFYPSGPFTCIFPKPIPVFPVLAVANIGSCVGLQNKVTN